MTHPDSDVLAEFRAGLITGRGAARISAHLSACERCTGLSDQLAEISALLAAVPAPVMPDAVAQRLESVLAAQVAQRDSAEQTVHASADDRAYDRARPRARRPQPRRGWDFRLVALRVLAPAAGVVVLAAGGYGLSRIGSSPTSSQAASSGVASAASSPQAVPTSKSRVAPAMEVPAKFGVVTSGINYQPATLVPLLEHELLLHHGATGNARELTPSSLRGCVLQVTRGVRPGTLLLVEKAHFQGQPAIVIVAKSGQHDAAWVTASSCSASSGHVLDKTTL